MAEGRRKQITTIVMWSGILTLFGFTRLVYLMDLPAGCHIDEAGMPYDAWSIFAVLYGIVSCMI